MANFFVSRRLCVFHYGLPEPQRLQQDWKRQVANTQQEFMKRRLRASVFTCAILATLAFRVFGAGVGDAAIQSDLQSYIASKTAAYGALTAFHFGVFSDIHMSEDGLGSWVLTRTDWANALTYWRNRGDLFDLIVGDLGYGYASDINNVLSGPRAVPDAPPIFYAMGNHELDSLTSGMGKRAWVDALFPGAVKSGSWSVISGLPPGNANHAYYSFDVGPSTHFVVLDGDLSATDGLRRYDFQTFGQTQLNWFAADVQANVAKNILVFIHEPIDQQRLGTTPYYTLNDKGSVIDILAGYPDSAAQPKQRYVFSGHLHSLSGITSWKGVNSVHVMQTSVVSGQSVRGVLVNINGDQVSVTQAGAAYDFNQHLMNQVVTVGSEKVVSVAEDGTSCGTTRARQMNSVSAEAGVVPTSGPLMLRADDMTWYDPRFVSEQLIKIQPGMKFSYDVYLSGVISGKDAVTVQPDWYMKDGREPPIVRDQNGIQLSRKSKDGWYHIYNEDVPFLGGRATSQWYHREFDLSPLAGNYVDGVYLTSGATRVNVARIYVDNIKFTWSTLSIPLLTWPTLSPPLRRRQYP